MEKSERTRIGSDKFRFASPDGYFLCFLTTAASCGVAVVWKQKVEEAQCSLWMYNKRNMLIYDLASSPESLLLLDVFKVSLLIWCFVFLSLQILLNSSLVE